MAPLSDDEKEFLSSFAEEIGEKRRSFDWPAWIVAVATCLPFAFACVWWTSALSQRVERLEEHAKSNIEEHRRLRAKNSWMLLHGKWSVDVPGED